MNITQIEYLGDFIAVVLLLSGIGFLIQWQVRHPLLSSLERCPIRRNRLPLFFPFLQLFVWLMSVWLLGLIIEGFFSSSPPDSVQFYQHIALVIVEVILSVFFVMISGFAFVRGLKGFGIRFGSFGKDLFWAAANLVAAYPVILLALFATLQAGQWLFGPEFGLEKHQTLEELQNASAAVKVFLVFSTLIVVPIFEELLFRGLMQSALRGYLSGPWPAIVITSLVFAAMHPGTHFLGIFVLSICLGYAYEKSGSLVRSILIHIFFNTTSVLAVLIESAA